MSGQVVRLRRLFAASCEEVFDAWLDAEGMSTWMRPGAVSSCTVQLEPHVGGQFLIVMCVADGEIVNRGEFRILERPAKLQFTWISSRWENQQTLITLEFRPHGEHCELLLTHERFPYGHSTDQLAGGWNQMLDKLVKHMTRS